MHLIALNVILNESRVFSGTNLNASVLLDSSDPEMVINEFLAEIRGVSHTGWVNIHTDKIYETEQEFFNVVYPLCQQLIPLRPGRHRFALCVSMPEGIPTSFENQFGSIRYTIKLILVSNNTKPNITETFPFFVISRSFFNDVPQAIMQPIDYRDEIDFTVCSLLFGTVFLQISLPRTAFCLGETIAAKIYVKNATRKNVKDCRLHLVLKTQLEAMSRYEHANDHKVIEQIIDTWLLDTIKARTEKNFNNCCLQIPKNSIPTHNNQQYINDQQNNNLLNTNILINNYDNMITQLKFDNKNALNSNANASIIILSYVLRFNALPGIETEIPLVITTEGYRAKPIYQNLTEHLSSSHKLKNSISVIDLTQPTCSKAIKF